MYTFKISINHQLKHLWVIIYYSLFIIGGAFFISYSRYGLIDYEKIMVIATIVLLLFFIPQLLLHINYFIKNKGDVLFYDPIGQKITINHRGLICELFIQ
jgi:hypothetical protein